jgi:hypothetical protein
MGTTSFKADLGKANISWLTDTFKMMLLTSSATPAASWAKRSDVTNEITGTGYTAGGAALASTTITAATTTQQYSSACGVVEYRDHYGPLRGYLQVQGWRV